LENELRELHQLKLKLEMEQDLDSNHSEIKHINARIKELIKQLNEDEDNDPIESPSKTPVIKRKIINKRVKRRTR
jgi:hypothetical protein